MLRPAWNAAHMLEPTEERMPKLQDVIWKMLTASPCHLPSHGRQSRQPHVLYDNAMSTSSSTSAAVSSVATVKQRILHIRILKLMPTCC